MTIIETRSATFLKRLVGFAVVVTVGLFVVHVVRSSRREPAIAPTEFDGFVADSVSHQLLRNAEIRVRLGPYSAEQTTDTFGRYSIAFASPRAEASAATVEIRAVGYGDYRNTIPLSPGSNYAEIMLNPGSRSAGSSDDADASLGLSAPVVAKAQVFVKRLPPDFMKAKTVYVATSRK
jgi:hypothetical protein